MSRYQRPNIILTWPQDSEFHGLVVRCRRPSLGEALTIHESDTDSGVEELDVIARMLAGELVDGTRDPVILEWNFHDHYDNPVPVTHLGLLRCDVPLLRSISMALLEATAGVSAPLSPPSRDGDPFLEESMRMGSVSVSPELLGMSS